jgi:hypothetical protein
VLRENGYHLSATGRQIASRSREFIFNKINQRPYINLEKQLLVDLHWNICKNRFLLPLEWNTLRGEMRALTIAGSAVPTLGKHHMMHYVFVHGSAHFWSRLFWLCDVAGVLRQDDAFDWTEFMAAAARMGTARSVGFGTLLSHLLLGSRIPPAVLHYMSCDRVLRPLVQYGLEEISDPDPMSNLSKFIKIGRHAFRLRDDWRYKLEHLLLFLRPSHVDLVTLRVSPVLTPLHYILRPFLLLRRRPLK